jgi:predicted ester cyclase
MSTSAASTSSPPSNAGNGELVRWAFERLNDRAVAPLKQLWTADTVVRFPDRTRRGVEEIAAYFEEAFAALPDWHMEIIALVEQGDEVFVRWHLTATHRGYLLGIAATDKQLAVDGIDHFTMREGKVISNFVVFDQMQYAREIGMMPADGSTGDRALKSVFNARTKLAQRLRR